MFVLSRHILTALFLSHCSPKLTRDFTPTPPRSPSNCATWNHSPSGYQWLRRDACCLSPSWRRAGRIILGNLPKQVWVHVEMGHKSHWRLAEKAVAFPSIGWFNHGLHRWRVLPCLSESPDQNPGSQIPSQHSCPSPGLTPSSPSLAPAQSHNATSRHNELWLWQNHPPSHL